MAFMKDVTIYEKQFVKIYINQCFAQGRKTYLYAIRRNDKTGWGDYIAGIVWSGRWRQYVFVPEKDTQWASSCLKNIDKFLDLINKKHRDKLRKR